jgi:hypothetical protein
MNCDPVTTELNRTAPQELMRFGHHWPFNRKRAVGKGKTTKQQKLRAKQGCSPESTKLHKAEN